MNNDNLETKSNKKKGERLKRCREYRKMSQEMLSEKSFLSTNYISMLERGVRSLDWDKAMLFSDILNVSPSFIMCETNIMEKKKPYSVLDFRLLDSENGYAEDIFFINFLIELGYTFSFNIVRFFDGRKIKENNIHGHKVWDINGIQENVLITQLEGFSFDDPICRLKEGEMSSEIIIVSVIFNETKYSFGEFSFTIHTIYNYIKHTFDNLRSFHFKYEISKGMDFETESLIMETRDEISFSSDLRNLKAGDKIKIGDYEGEIVSEKPHSKNSLNKKIDNYIKTDNTD